MPACERALDLRQFILEEARRCAELNGTSQRVGRVESSLAENQGYFIEERVHVLIQA